MKILVKMKRLILKDINLINNLILFLIKSIHFWAWLVFILGTIFCYYYPREWAIYDETTFNVDEIFAPILWYFIWMMGLGVWIFIYSLIGLFSQKHNHK